jgi:cytochrome P450
MTTRTMSAIPGPTGTPVLGAASRLRRDLLGTLLADFEEYGDFVLYRVGPRRGPRWLRADTLAVHHPHAVHRVLTNTLVFTRHTTSFRVLRELFGENLVTTNGESWGRQKRLLQPLFTPRTVRAYEELIGEEARRVLDRHRFSETDVLEVARTMETYALRVLGHTLFKDEDGIDDEIVASLERLVPMVGRLVRSRASAPVRPPLVWPTHANRSFLATRAELYGIVDRVLEKRARRQPSGDAPDLLGRLMEAHRADPKGVSAQEIRDQALIFLLSGHTTTSNALTSTVYLLASNPEAQERVARAALTDEEPEDDQDLVRCAVQEGMRLYPPSYVIGRRAAVDAELDGWLVRAGTNVLVSPWVTHRHPRFWERAEEFRPERFLGGRRAADHAYFPFGGGGRACIGRHFAMLEATIMVRELLRRYELVALDEDVPMAQLISLRPAGAVRVRCIKRESRPSPITP